MRELKYFLGDWVFHFICRVDVLQNLPGCTDSVLFLFGRVEERHWLFKQSILTEGDKLEIHSESLFEGAFNLSCGQMRYLNKTINHSISNICWLPSALTV